MNVLTRLAVDSILPAAGLIAATSGVLFAIYYWTRLGRDQLMARCAIAAVVLHLLGYLSLFHLPSRSLAHREAEKVSVSIEWRSADDVRGEEGLADEQSTRADLPEETLEAAPNEALADDVVRPGVSEELGPRGVTPTLENPMELPTRPEALPMAEAVEAPPIEQSAVIEPKFIPADPALDQAEDSPAPSAIDRSSRSAGAEPAPPMLDTENEAPVARWTEERPLRADAAAAPAVEEASLVPVVRPIVPNAATTAAPPEPEPVRLPPSSESVESAVGAPPTNVEPSELEPAVPPVRRGSINEERDVAESVPERMSSPAKEPTSVVKTPAPARFPIQQTPAIPDDSDAEEMPERVVKPSSAVPIDVAALASKAEAAPNDVMAPRTFWENRIAPNRLEIVYRHGGSKETEKAVADALEWLAAHQSEDGRWDSDGFDLRCPAGDRCEGHAVERQSDTGLTGLSLLAFLGAGHTHLSTGKYRETVRRGLSWLLRVQRSDGDLQYGGRIYAHAMATISITEAFAMTKDERLRGPAQKGILWLAGAQHAESGGWRYGPGQFGDTSVYGWAVLSLRSARSAGLDVPETTWLAARRWLPLVVSGRHQGLAAYRPGYPPSHAMTAEALFCRQVLEGKVDAGLASEAADHLLTKLPEANDYHLYYWYYGTLSLFQMGGPAWERWNDRLTATLLGSQTTSGHAKGSWDPKSPFGVDGGRVFSTACSCLCLEVYYRYLPLYQAGPGGSPSSPAPVR